MFDAGKTRIIWLPSGEKKYNNTLSRFHAIPEHNGRMDGQTDRQTDGGTDLLYQYRTSMCWRAIKTDRPDDVTSLFVPKFMTNTPRRPTRMNRQNYISVIRDLPWYTVSVLFTGENTFGFTVGVNSAVFTCSASWRRWHKNLHESNVITGDDNPHDDISHNIKRRIKAGIDQ